VRVSVALATLDGERHLPVQLESLRRQTHLPYELVACDDGSSDATLDILERFAAEAPFPVWIHRNERRLGYRENFMGAVRRCGGDLVAFCDQDDLWIENKLSVCARPFADPSVSMVSHSWWVGDEDLRIRQRREWRHETIGLGHPWRASPGFSIVFRPALLHPLSWLPVVGDFHDMNRPMTHDLWVAFLAGTVGSRVFLPNLLAVYRQHANNTCGAVDERLARRIALARNAASGDYLRRSTCAAEYARFWGAVALAADHGPVHGANALRAEDYWSRLSAALRRRASLYSPAGRRTDRLRVFLSMLQGGCYHSHRRSGLGLAAAVKDALVALSTVLSYGARGRALASR
jgi:glycosyltransferase involved in cell wall biosynthesis